MYAEGPMPVATSVNVEILVGCFQSTRLLSGKGSGYRYKSQSG